MTPCVLWRVLEAIQYVLEYMLNTPLICDQMPQPSNDAGLDIRTTDKTVTFRTQDQTLFSQLVTAAAGLDLYTIAAPAKNSFGVVVSTKQLLMLIGATQHPDGAVTQV